MNYGQFCEIHKGNQMDICQMICEYAEAAYKAGHEEGTKKVQAQADHNCFWIGFRLGREDGWKLAKKISDMTMEESENIFKESRYFGTIAEKFTAAEAIEKIKEHEAKHTDKSCESCKFEDKAIGEEPCKNCKHSYMDEWEAKR